MNRPLALIEIGTSAAFILLWDKYSYSYHTGEIVMNDWSLSVEIKSNIKGNKMPSLFFVIPRVSHIYGLYLHINECHER